MQPFNEQSFEDADLCLSGGADGADLQFGMCGGHAGHQVIHFSFAGHRTQAPESEVVRLTEAQLREADPFLEVANQTLGRRLPYQKPWIINLLRRDFFQVRWSQRVYAVSEFGKKGLIDGGTAWAVQMFLDRLPDGEAYLFDQVAGTWLAWLDRRWQAAEPPVPHGIWAGVGKRALNDSGKQAIRKLLSYEPGAA